MTLKVVSLAILGSLSKALWSRLAYSETIVIWTKRRGSATSFLCVQMETPPFSRWIPAIFFRKIDFLRRPDPPLKVLSSQNDKVLFVAIALAMCSAICRGSYQTKIWVKNCKSQGFKTKIGYFWSGRLKKSIFLKKEQEFVGKRGVFPFVHTKNCWRVLGVRSRSLLSRSWPGETTRLGLTRPKRRVRRLSGS